MDAQDQSLKFERGVTTNMGKVTLDGWRGYYEAWILSFCKGIILVHYNSALDAVMTRLWMNLKWVDIWFHWGNPFCTIQGS
jgi:hypothetical protein